MSQFRRSCILAFPVLSIAVSGAVQPQLHVDPVIFQIEPNSRFASTDLRKWEVFTRAGVQLSRTLSVVFEGADKGMRMEGVGATGVELSIYQGNDPALWKPRRASYAAVAYRGLYPGIDLVYRRTGEGLKGDFIVQPGADAGQIRFRFEGGTVRLNGGELEVSKGGEKLIERIPSVYERSGQDRVSKTARYRQYPDGSIGFVLENRDLGRELVIDPDLLFSTYIAGSSLDQVTAMAYSTFNNTLLVGGWTESSDLLGVTDPTTFKGSTDGFFGRFTVSAAGAVTLASMTLIGGSGTDKVTSIAVNSVGAVLLGGSTTSTNFPASTVAPAIWRSKRGTSDGFLVLFAAGASAFQFSCYFGGSAADQITAVALDSNYVLYLAGTTSSTDLPVPRDSGISYRGGPTDGFYAVLNPDLSVRYLSYVGGAGTDSVLGMAMLNGELYLTGATDSVNMAVVNPFTSGVYTGGGSAGGQDAYVMKVNASGTTTYCSYLGGSNGYAGAPEMGYAIAVSAAGEAFVTGVTSSLNFPTTAGVNQVAANPLAYSTTHAFLTKFTPAGGLSYSTYLGGTSWDQGNAVVVMKTGYAAVVGMTLSADFPIAAGLQTSIASNGSYDAFISIFTPAGKLAYSSFFGGAGADAAYALTTNSNSDLFFGGLTGSYNLPKVAPLQTYINSSGYHGFIAKMSPISQFGVYRPSSKQFILNPDYNPLLYAVYSWSNITCANPQPVVGDWDSTGWTRIGMYCDGVWYLDMNGDNLYTASVDKTVTFGFAATQPVVGDWDNTGKVRLGFFQNGLWFLDLVGDYVLRYTPQAVFSMGGAGDYPIVGDFLNVGQTRLGIVRFNHWLLDLNGDHVADTNYNFGATRDKFVFADWDNTGVKRLGVFRQSTTIAGPDYPPGWWFLDITGNNVLDNPIYPCVPDRCFSNGIPGDLPVVGIRGSWLF